MVSTRRTSARRAGNTGADKSPAAPTTRSSELEAATLWLRMVRRRTLWLSDCRRQSVCALSDCLTQRLPVNSCCVCTPVQAQIHRFWMTPALMMAFWRAEDSRADAGWSESTVAYPIMMFSIYMACWELPSGIIADKIGRRTSLTIAVICYGVARAMWGFVDIWYASNVSAFLEGAAQALYSGSLEALLHELCSHHTTAKGSDLDQLYQRHKGSVDSNAMLLDLAANAAAAGLLYHGFSFHTLMKLELLFHAIGLLCYLQVQDPQKRAKKGSSYSNDAGDFFGSIRIPRPCQRLLLLRGLWGAFVYTVMFNCIDPICHAACTTTSDNCACGPAAWGSLTLARIPPLMLTAHPMLFKQLTPITEPLGLLVASTVLLGGLVIFPGSAPLGIGLCVLFIACHMVADLHLSTQINAQIEDSHRATIISIGSIVTMVLYALGSASLQYFVNTHGFNHVTYGAVLVAHFGGAALLRVAIERGCFASFEPNARDGRSK